MVAQHKQGKSDRSHLTKGIIQFSQQSSYYNLFRRRPKKSQLCYPGQNLPKTHKRRHIITLSKHLFPPFLTFYFLFELILKQPVTLSLKSKLIIGITEKLSPWQAVLMRLLLKLVSCLLLQLFACNQNCPHLKIWIQNKECRNNQMVRDLTHLIL